MRSLKAIWRSYQPKRKRNSSVEEPDSSKEPHLSPAIQPESKQEAREPGSKSETQPKNNPPSDSGSRVSMDPENEPFVWPEPTIPMEAFQHSPLPPGQSIRLATIRRGTFDDPITIRLKLVELSEAEFFALSYCWGSSSDPITITVDCKYHLVSRNLAAAIRRVRRDDMDVVGWIDALCIDQANIPERNSQVRIMRQIYQKATRVVIYIGEETEDTAIAIGIIRKLVDIAHLKERSAQNRLRQIDTPSFGLMMASAMRQSFRDMPTWDETRAQILVKELPNGASPDWLALSNFYNRAWFGRIWVLQEVVVAIADPVVVCGESVFTWSTIGEAAYHFHHDGYRGRVVLNEEQVDFSFNACRMYVSRISYQKKQKESLLGLLRATESFAATDARDKVFALLGLIEAGDNSPAMAADYGKDVINVYRDIARHLLYHHSSLEILSCVGEIPKRNAMFKCLPTWAPDWTQERLSTAFVHDLRDVSEVALRHYNASGGSPVSLLDHDDRDVIGALGMCVDEIEEVADRWPIWDDISEEHPAPTSFRPVTDQWDRFACKLDPYPGGGRTLDAFWRTLIANVDRNGMPVHDDMFFNFARFCYSLPGPPSGIHRALKPYFDRTLLGAKDDSKGPPGSSLTFLTVLRRASLGRRFIVTKKGYMGLGPADSRIGDKVYVLSGGKVPYILRNDVNCKNKTQQTGGVGARTTKRTADEEVERNNTDQDFMNLVGEAYIHGIMKGESIRNTSGKPDWRKVFLR